MTFSSASVVSTRSLPPQVYQLPDHSPMLPSHSIGLLILHAEYHYTLTRLGQSSSQRLWCAGSGRVSRPFCTVSFLIAESHRSCLSTWRITYHQLQHNPLFLHHLWSPTNPFYRHFCERYISTRFLMNQIPPTSAQSPHSAPSLVSDQPILPPLFL